MAASQKYFQFKALLMREGWLESAYVGIDANGLINYLSQNSPGDVGAIEKVEGYAMPGFQNAHSHAFQYAMAGLAEKHPANQRDDFWTWREAMYQCALSVDPDQAEAIAAMLYAEMLRYGYTQVAEFHYLHHDKDGRPYSHLAEMGERMIAAAKRAGIKITLIPVFYQKGGFGLPPQPRQKRFISSTIDDYLRLLDASANLLPLYEGASLGISIHSLRAVHGEDIVKTLVQGPLDVPFHIHVAEQKKEVEECMAFYKQRPVEWLLNNIPVDERFFLVHATHLNDDEVKGIARSKATVVLCPSTEGNLGDGFFRMTDFTEENGKWCIGTDSHIGLNPLEELRMIDYRQRLLSNLRNPFSSDAGSSMIEQSSLNGRHAMGIHTENFFEMNRAFDAVVFDGASPLIASTSLSSLLSTILYTSDSSFILGTLVNGQWKVRLNQPREVPIKTDFLRAIKALKNR
jgi:formimidoylglutamate deiminase